MTKKDYKVIAQSIRDSFVDSWHPELNITREDYRELWGHVAEDLASALANEDKRFKYGQFLQDCGLKMTTCLACDKPIKSPLTFCSEDHRHKYINGVTIK